MDSNAIKFQFGTRIIGGHSFMQQEGGSIKPVFMFTKQNTSRRFSWKYPSRCY